jgi:hypothetical protein
MSLDDLGFRVDWTLLQKEKGRKRRERRYHSTFPTWTHVCQNN